MFWEFDSIHDLEESALKRVAKIESSKPGFEARAQWRDNRLGFIVEARKMKNG